MSGLSQQLCLIVSLLYNDTPPHTTPLLSAPRHAPDSCTSDTLSARYSAYRRYLFLMTAMLERLGADYVTDALDFVGVHERRLHRSLEECTSTLSDDSLMETEETCRFLSALAVHRIDWRRHLPAVLSSLMTYVCAVLQRSVALLVRPRFLQHLLDVRE